MNADELRVVLEKHKKWLTNEDGGERANLHGADLSDVVDLIEANLRMADLSDANLRGANLDGADLSEAYISWADLRNANLRKADLRGADLRNANLRGANLRGADIDFSCWPLWCGSKSVKVDAKIARQLAAHFCALDCNDPEYIAAREAILEFAKKSHRADDLGIVDGETEK